MRRRRDVGGAPSEDPHLAFVRQAGAGHEVHHHFRGRRVEAGHRDALAGRDRERLDPQRTQAP